MTSRQRFSAFLLTFVSVTLLACGGGSNQTTDSGNTPPPPPPPSGNQGPAGPTGKVITVEMMTDDAGNNKFVPNDITAKAGDILRFKLVTGVHNVHFLPDSNPSITGLPAAGQLLQAPGQTEDVVLSWGPGRFYFQCDPHALLGMIGHVTVN